MRAAGGTLVLVHPGALPEPLQLRMGEALGKTRPTLVVSCAAGNETLVPRLERQLEGLVIKLPSALAPGIRRHEPPSRLCGCRG